MQYVRCRGLKVPEIMQDGGMRVLPYRCIHCGDVVDHKIILHRLRHCDLRPSRARPPIYQDLRRRGRKSVAG